MGKGTCSTTPWRDGLRVDGLKANRRGAYLLLPRQGMEGGKQTRTDEGRLRYKAPQQKNKGRALPDMDLDCVQLQLFGRT